MSSFLNKQNILRAALVLGLFGMSAGIAFGVFLYSSFQRISVHANKPAIDSAAASTAPTATPQPHIDAFNQLEPYALALLGYGGGTHEGGKLSDSIMIVYIVQQMQKVFLISVPRDLWIALPINSEVDASQSAHWKINAAYAIGSDDRGYPKKPVQYTGPAGGGELAKYALQTVTGIPIDHFASLDFSGFIKTIDVLQGVDVKVARTFDDPLYPIEGHETDTCGKSPEEIKAISATMSATQMENAHVFSCRYEDLHFDAGTVHMDGATALKYVRSRHSPQDGGDFNRAARQRNLVLAVKKKIFSIDFFPKAIPFISSLSYDLQTDLTLENMEEFLQYKDTLSSYQVVGIALTDKNVLAQTQITRQDVIIPKAGVDQWDSVKSWLNDQMQPVASASATATPSASPALKPLQPQK